MFERVINTIKRSIAQNLLFMSLYRFIGSGAPIVMADNPKQYIEEGYTGNPDVYSIIQRILVYSRNVLLKVQTWDGEQWNEDPVHHVSSLLNHPNEDQGKTEFRDKALVYLLATGNTYIYKFKLKEGANAGKVQELHVMPADQTEIISSGNPFKPVGGYRVNYYFSDPIPADDVIHVRYANPDYNGDGSDLYGLSPLKAARKLVTQSNDTYTANMRALQNTGAVGILSGEKDEQYSAEGLQAVQDRFDEKYSGPSNRGKTVISSKPLKWQKMGLSLKELMTVETQEVSLKHLCNVFGAPLELFNSDASSFNNRTEAKKAMYSDCVIPLMEYLKDELERGLKDELSRDGKTARIVVDSSGIDALQDDLEKRIKWMRAAGVFRNSEIREAVNYGAIENDPITEELMSEVYMPSGFVPLGSVMIPGEAEEEEETV